MILVVFYGALNFNVRDGFYNCAFFDSVSYELVLSRFSGCFSESRSYGAIDEDFLMASVCFFVGPCLLDMIVSQTSN